MICEAYRGRSELSYGNSQPPMLLPRVSDIGSVWVCERNSVATARAAGRSSFQEGGIDGMTCPLGGLRGFAE